jgi:prepilin-type N-terminal cleavage/methylation domain-containing protein
MKIESVSSSGTCRKRLGYSMIEVLVAVAVMGVMFVSLYAGMTSGFAVTQLARENLRATQIMLERMEGIRLYNWNQLVYSNMIPATFTNYYYPLAQGGEAKGIAYSGTMSITNAALAPTATYTDKMRAIVVTLNWNSGGVPRTRTMITYSARDGLQNYIFNN